MIDIALKHSHSLLRWIILIFTILTLIRAYQAQKGTLTNSEKLRKNSLGLLICMDIQLVLGMVMYVRNGWLQTLTQGLAMTNKTLRFWSVEHLFGMLVALVLIHLAYRINKTNLAISIKGKKIFTTILIAFIIILFTIPWPFRAEIGRALMP